MPDELLSDWTTLAALTDRLQGGRERDRELIEQSERKVRESWALLREVRRLFPEINGSHS